MLEGIVIVIVSILGKRVITIMLKTVVNVVKERKLSLQGRRSREWRGSIL
jgi:hypothetical protein